jgi:hypothetical protein
MSGQGAFARAAFTRCENNNVHTLVSRLTQENKMNQHTDSLKTIFTVFHRHGPVFHAFLGI